MEMTPDKSHVPPAWPAISYLHSGTAFAQRALAQLEFIDRAGWYELYRRTSDGTHWRLETEDKYQQRFLVRIDDLANWKTFDSAPLEKGLLLESRGGMSSETCMWQRCGAASLNGSAYCLDHTYEKGVRK
jgi:hypothetical protein